MKNDVTDNLKKLETTNVKIMITVKHIPRRELDFVITGNNAEVFLGIYDYFFSGS